MAKVATHYQDLQAMLHTDVVQALGKVPVDLWGDLGEYEMVTLVGDNFGSPKGVSAMYVLPGCLDRRG